MTEITVEQCDREAASPFQGSWPPKEANSDDLDQAFARHRIQHGAQGEPDLATIAYMSGAYDGRKDMAAQLAEAQREIARLRQALEPFAFREMEKDEGLADIQYVWETIYSDRVQDWFSYEDIEAARAALEAKL